MMSICAQLCPERQQERISVGGYLGKIDKLSVWEYLGKIDKIFCVGVGNEKISFVQCIHTSHAWGSKFYKIDSRIDTE